MRSAYTAAAQEGGLGTARQVHRALNSFSDKPAGVIVGGTTIAGLFFATRSDWLALVIAVAVGALLTAAYINLVEPAWPRRIVVCNGGLILDDPRRERRVISWAAIESAGPVVRPGPTIVFELVVQDADRAETIELGSYTGRSALTRSILTRQPQPISPTPRIVAAVAVVALVGLAVWLVVLPRFVVREEPILPSSSDGFGDACDSPGIAYTSAAAYTGPPPHPLVVAPPGIRWRLDPQNKFWYVEDESTIQLIACVELDGDGGLTGEFCSYSTSNVGIGGRTETQHLRLGRYTITVYELRTHREVGSSQVVGDHLACPDTKLSDDEVFSTPSDAQLHQALDPHIQRAG